MKSQVYDRFGGGLIVLVMLTIAFVASEAEPKFREPASEDHSFALDADFRISIDSERLEKLEHIRSVIEKALPIELSLSLEEPVTPVRIGSE